ncbi:unnamed protein product, partial [Tetraodon nigroviridis]
LTCPPGLPCPYQRMSRKGKEMVIR